MYRLIIYLESTKRYFLLLYKGKILQPAIPFDSYAYETNLEAWEVGQLMGGN